MIPVNRGPRPELLAPAGDVEKLGFAYQYGADAAYAGAGAFSLRAPSGLSLEDIESGMRLARAKGKRLYLALNAFARPQDMRLLPQYLEQLAQLRPHAFIVSDPGVFRLCQKHAPDVPLHISTQANSMNGETLRFWSELGASRVVLSRELSLAESAAMAGEAAAAYGLESEIFVHGALCISYSGRCLLSTYLNSRSANQGDCSQPCRWSYALCEEKRPGQYFPLEEDDRGSYVLNSRDLCLLPQLPVLLAGGFSSWKIEGRNKSAYYVANVTRVYRAALDDCLRQEAGEWACAGSWLEELGRVSHREYTDNFAFGVPGPEAFRYDQGQPLRGYDFAAVALGWDNGLLRLEQRNHLALGEELELLLPQGGQVRLPITALYDQNGKALDAARHPRQIVFLPAAAIPAGLSWPLICRRPAR